MLKLSLNTFAYEITLNPHHFAHLKLLNLPNFILPNYHPISDVF